MKLKQWGSLLLTCMLSVSLAVGRSKGSGGTAQSDPSSEGESAINETGFPIVDDKMTVTGFAGKFFANADWNNIKLWQEYEK